MEQEDASPAEETSFLQPSPERKLLLWAALIFGTNMLCLLMLAARAAAPVEMRGYFDIIIIAALVGVGLFASIRVMFLFTYRLLDLLVIVTTLAASMKFAIDAARSVRDSKWPWLAPHLENAGNPAVDTSAYILYAEACMLTACLMLGGAAIGLRNCRLLAIESPLKRAVTLVFGMTTLPALAGLVIIPIHLLGTFVGETEPMRDVLTWSAALLFSFVATLGNAMLGIKAVALNTENVTPGGNWRD